MAINPHICAVCFRENKGRKPFRAIGLRYLEPKEHYFVEGNQKAMRYAKNETVVHLCPACIKRFDPKNRQPEQLRKKKPEPTEKLFPEQQENPYNEN